MFSYRFLKVLTDVIGEKIKKKKEKTKAVSEATTAITSETHAVSLCRDKINLKCVELPWQTPASSLYLLCIFKISSSLVKLSFPIYVNKTCSKLWPFIVMQIIHIKTICKFP